jgi:hypothetical protein
MFNLTNAAKIFRIITWIKLIVDRTLKVTVLFLMFLLPIQLGFAFLTYVYMGPYLEKYSTLIGCAKMQIITMMGQQDSMSLMRSSFNFTIMWTMSFIIFFAYFFLTSSIVGVEDGFDVTCQERGYPSDFAKASKWSPQEYIIWMCATLPKNTFKKVMDVLEYPEDQFDDTYDYAENSDEVESEKNSDDEEED